MCEEISLNGGRITASVIRKGAFVHRSMGPSSPFVHRVLRFLEANKVAGVPYFRGIDAQNCEILDFIDGTVPADLGKFSSEQCCLAVRLIKQLHECLKKFPGCPAGLTVCHRDLSPCNFVFKNNQPVAVIDWDAAAFGDPLDDLAYAVWMWLDIGNEENSQAFIKARMDRMLSAYGAAAEARRGFGPRVLGQMDRVAQGVFPTAAQTQSTRLWVAKCNKWFNDFLVSYPVYA